MWLQNPDPSKLEGLPVFGWVRGWWGSIFQYEEAKPPVIFLFSGLFLAYFWPNRYKFWVVLFLTKQI